MEPEIAVLAVLGVLLAFMANTGRVARLWRKGRGRLQAGAARALRASDPAVAAPTLPRGILTPDQRLRVFVSSTLRELAPERATARAAIGRLRLSPVMFELGARPHPPRELYRAYLEQSHIFLGIYWQRYGWVAPGEEISGLEDEYRLSGGLPKLIYLKTPAPEREARLSELLALVQADDFASYKSFSTPEELAELIENDLALLLTERFAAPEAAASEPTGVDLPAPMTPLIGRERELAELETLLVRQQVRLVTLSGPGGTGKSRLALELALRSRPHFPDGALFVSLAPLRDPSLVAGAIAQALGLKLTSPLEGLKLHFRDRRALLVLDNFEQIVSAAPIINELLAAAPGLAVVVTSRQVLNLSGEFVYQVPPLTLPTGVLGLAELEASEAVRLFGERARAVDPTFALTPDNAAVITAICRRLDGLPLAIELAAARTRLLSPAALLEQLGHRLDVLQGGPRDLPGRQQTLRDTIDWSFQLLSDTEKLLFMRLGVFAGGYTLDAVRALGIDTAGDSADAAETTLAGLVDKSLVRHLVDENRFTTLETLREYALEKLQASGGMDAAQRAHADHVVVNAEMLSEQLRAGIHQESTLREIEREHDNVRAAMGWALAHREFETVARLAWALGVAWWIGAHSSEGHRWMQEALALRDTAASLSKESEAKILYTAGTMAFWQGDLGGVPLLLSESLVLFEELGHRQGAGTVLISFAVTATSQGEFGRAAELIARSSACLEAAGDAWGSLLANLTLARNALRQGDYRRSAGIFEEALELTRASGNRFMLLLSLNGLASVALRQKDSARAASLFAQSLTISHRIGYLEGVAWALEGHAVAAALQRSYARSVRLMAASEVLRGTIQFPGWADTRNYLDELEPDLRRRLGASFERVRAEGQAMSLEKAVAYALASEPSKRFRPWQARPESVSF